MMHPDDIFVYLLLFTVAILIPGYITIWNIYNLCSGKRYKSKQAAVATILIGGLFYSLLYASEFDAAGDWYEVVNTMQTHYSIASEFLPSFAIPYGLGLLCILIITYIPVKMLPPIVGAFSVAGVLIGNIMQIVYAIHISKNVNDWSLLLYVFHLNIFILSISTIRFQIKEQVALIKERNITYQKQWLNKLYQWLGRTEHMAIFIFVCMIVLIAVLDIIFILMGQGADGPVKAFTMTADWTFSQQIPPPPTEYDGHYLCTVAAGGHDKIVKPLRYGKRRGQMIIVNRQLCVANAFEELIQEKMPRFHTCIRSFYDTYGYPVSKHITTPYRADVIYILMKPLEWIFLLVLYTFDVNPEKRIGRQYL